MMMIMMAVNDDNNDDDGDGDGGDDDDDGGDDGDDDGGAGGYDDDGDNTVITREIMALMTRVMLEMVIMIKILQDVEIEVDFHDTTAMMPASTWVVLKIRVPFRVLLMRVPHYVGDLKSEPNWENYPHYPWRTFAAPSRTRQAHGRPPGVGALVCRASLRFTQPFISGLLRLYDDVGHDA